MSIPLSDSIAALWISGNGPVNLVRSLILIALGGSLLIMAIRRLRRYHLKERYALLFLFVGTPFLILAVWPGALDLISQRLNIEVGTVILLCISTFLFLIVFELLTIVSLQDRKIATLAQMVGILMEKQKKLDRAQEALPAEPVQPEPARQKPIHAEPGGSEPQKGSGFRVQGSEVDSVEPVRAPTPRRAARPTAAAPRR